MYYICDDKFPLHFGWTRWEDRINYGAEDYGGINTQQGLDKRVLSRDELFAQNLVRRAAKTTTLTINHKIDRMKQHQRQQQQRQDEGVSVRKGEEEEAGSRSYPSTDSSDDSMRPPAPADLEKSQEDEMKLRERMFWGLSKLWEEGLVFELNMLMRRQSSP